MDPITTIASIFGIASGGISVLGFFHQQNRLKRDLKEKFSLFEDLAKLSPDANFGEIADITEWAFENLIPFFERASIILPRLQARNSRRVLAGALGAGISGLLIQNDIQVPGLFGADLGNVAGLEFHDLIVGLISGGLSIRTMDSPAVSKEEEWFLQELIRVEDWIDETFIRPGIRGMEPLNLPLPQNPQN